MTLLMNRQLFDDDLKVVLYQHENNFVTAILNVRTKEISKPQYYKLEDYDKAV